MANNLTKRFEPTEYWTKKGNMFDAIGNVTIGNVTN